MQMSRMRYVIMANGNGRRWANYWGIPKQLISIEGETLLERTVRLFKQADPSCEIIVSSSDPRFEVQGAIRHAPLNGELELDRFCYELIEDDICFLYGDVYYSEECVKEILRTSPDGGMIFFGTETSIVAVKCSSADTLKKALDDLHQRIDRGEIDDAKGWQLYHLVNGMKLDGKEIGPNYVVIADTTRDFNRPSDLESFQGGNVDIP